MNKFLPYLNVFGYTPSSLKDYPNKITSVMFFKLCNMACTFCHNMAHMTKLPAFDANQLRSVINDSINNKFTDAITITGGEPTLHGINLINLLHYYRRNTNKLLKLDTNGTNPDILKTVINEKLVDYVAMDIKGDFEQYKERFNYTGDTLNLYKSAELLDKSSIAHEFRATIFPEFTMKDMEFISHFPNVKLQEYRQVENE